MKRFLFFLLCPLITWVVYEGYKMVFCKEFQFQKEISNINIKVDIVELNKKMRDDNIEEILKKYPILSRYYSSTSMVQSMITMYGNEEFKKLQNDVNKEFADISYLRDEFTYALKAIKYFHPSMKTPQIYTMVTGFGTDIYIDDDIIIIGLEYFLRDKSIWTPPKMYPYIYNTYTPKSISAKVITMLVSKLIVTDRSSKCLLRNMIDYGRIKCATKFCLPNISDELILDYSKDDYEYLKSAQGLLWTYFVENRLFFSDNYLDIRTFIGPSPFTSEISQDCPGNVGGYLGYEIVKSYMHNTSTRVDDLLLLKDYQKIFNDSKYNPLYK